MNYDKNFEKIVELLFDMAVNSGPENAIRKFNESNKNFYTMLDNRRKYYQDIIKSDASQMEFAQGWENRLKTLENNANNMLKEGFYRPPYYNDITPFDEGYKGNLQTVGDIPDKESKKNKYQYNRNKAIEGGFIKNSAKDNFNTNFKAQNGYDLVHNEEPYFKRSLDDMAPWEIEELVKNFI